MKISIITVTKNSKAGLLRAIECVRKQTYKNIEHIIVDGGSTDGTKEMMDDGRWMIDNVKFFSEADDGIYDAINKGIKLASGDVIGLLHSDDLYTDENVIAKYADAFKSDSGQAGMTGRIDAVYSDLVYVKNKSNDKSQKSKDQTDIQSSNHSIIQPYQSGITELKTTNYSVIRYWRSHTKSVDSGSESGMTAGSTTNYSVIRYWKSHTKSVDSGSESGMTAGSTTNLPTGQAGYSLLTTNYSVIRYWRSHTKSVDSGSGSGMTTSGYQSLITDHLLRKGWMPPHPTLFIRKDIFEKYGLYNTDLKIASDYEMILRLFYKYKITSNYLPLTTYLMSIGGASNKSVGNILQKSKEDLRSLKMNGINFPILTLVSKNFRKLPQFLARDLS